MAAQERAVLYYMSSSLVAMSASNTGVIRVRVRMSILYVAYDCTCKYNLITVRPCEADRDLIL